MGTLERWPKIKEIIGSALEREAHDRQAFLDQACAQDDALRAEVESLLAAHDEAGGLSENPFAATLAIDPAGEAKTIGPYRLIYRLGVGGMGQVWLAEQTEPLRRRVALKLIRAGMFDDALVKRFQSERQSLAIMEHPAIAKVLDAGASPQGQPYFAMEYVDGLPITGYCDRKKLGICERLKLFVQVCEGVQHAHQKAIIHRDLKPSNILVTEVDGNPQPRIIDFGLAKAAVPQAIAETLFTHVGSFLGTPGYMSPEQADPSVDDIDTRTDVYSLGVVLYELLTGCLPFDTTDWKNKRIEEVLRELRDADPERPSTKVSANRDTSAATAAARSMEASQLVRSLRGDLDWVTLKALEKERDRRYGTPTALAVDIERYLANMPVEARPASTPYRTRKYIRRHRVAVAVASGAAILMVAFTAMQTVQLRRISRERDRADRITEFMTNMFQVSNPSEARGNSITAREILDKSSKEIDTGLAQDRELQAQMLLVMGNVYEELGLYSRAQSLLERSAQVRRQIFGPKHPDTLKSTDDLAWVLYRQGHLSEAEKLQRELLDARRAALRPNPFDIARSADHLASTLAEEGHYAEAEKLDREALAVATRSLGPDHPLTLGTMTNLGGTLQREEHYAESETLLRSALELERGKLGVEHSTTLVTMTDLAGTLIKMGKYADAETLQEETREIQRRVLGPDHPDTAVSTYNLACLAMRQGNREQALALLRDAVDHGLTPDAILNMKEDEDLVSLHGDLRFEALVTEAEKRVPVRPKSN